MGVTVGVAVGLGVLVGVGVGVGMLVGVSVAAGTAVDDGVGCSFTVGVAAETVAAPRWHHTPLSVPIQIVGVEPPLMTRGYVPPR